jgi:DNA-binding GntR family transcriptional regulator
LVTQFTADEVRQIYTLRVELELLALQWARTRVTEGDLCELGRQIAEVVDAGERGDRREFLELDLHFTGNAGSSPKILILPRLWSA